MIQHLAATPRSSIQNGDMAVTLAQSYTPACTDEHLNLISWVGIGQCPVPIAIGLENLGHETRGVVNSFLTATRTAIGLGGTGGASP